MTAKKKQEFLTELNNINYKKSFSYYELGTFINDLIILSKQEEYSEFRPFKNEFKNRYDHLTERMTAEKFNATKEAMIKDLESM